MSNNKSSAAGGGIGFFGLLAITFIVLKLLHYIDWSWWWVLAPIWWPLALFLVGAIAIVLWYLVFRPIYRFIFRFDRSTR